MTIVFFTRNIHFTRLISILFLVNRTPTKEQLFACCILENKRTRFKKSNFF